MILTKQDITEFENIIERTYDIFKTKSDVAFESALNKLIQDSKIDENEFGGYLEGYTEEIIFNGWLANNPQVLMAGATLQEFVAEHEAELYRRLVEENFIPKMVQPSFRKFDGTWFLSSHRGKEGVYGYSIEKLKKAVELDDDDIFDESVFRIDDLENIINNAKSYIDTGVQDPTTFVSPLLWTPYQNSQEKIFLQTTTTPILRALQDEKIELESLSWKELEDIVAEVLRRSGMEIHSVRESPQGGRDIIARAELVPGEIISIAVEVKHRKTVDRPILHTALHQNSHFPALMLVTSGRFTAGVVKEAKKPENRMRVFLKDGVAIRNMIQNKKGEY